MTGFLNIFEENKVQKFTLLPTAIAQDLSNFYNSYLPI